MKRAVLAISILLYIFGSAALAADNPVEWAGPHQLTMPRQNPTISGSLQKAMSSMSSEGKLAAWIFFTDKGIFDSNDYNNSLTAVEAILTPAARERRLKARGEENLVDFRDLPVNEEYMAEVRQSGAEIRHVLRWFNAVTVNATRAQLEILASRDCVRFMKVVAHSKTNLNLGLEPVPGDMTLVSLDYGASLGQLEQLNAVVAHELGFKGKGVIICMMDTGFKQGHDAFQNIIDSGRLIAQYDFVNGDDNTDYDADQDLFNQADHGTITWSTLGGEAPGHLYGPSYMASFVLSKSENLDGEHHIEEDNWAAGALWADSIGASVISASLGYRYGFSYPDEDYTYEDMDGNTTIVTIAADLAAYNGIAVATAQGNSGNEPGTLIAPADGDSVIACGAVDPNGNLAGFSSFGPTYDGRTKPEVCAQGMWTVCVDPYDMHGYTTANGTSLSTPLVGGVCGVLLSAHPNWTPMMVREALMSTADRSDNPDNEYGWGIIDLGRALNYHPQGDIVFSHGPVLGVNPGQPVPVQISVTGGAPITDAYVYYREGTEGEFSEIEMSTSDNVVFDAEIPDLSGSDFQYYFKAVDGNESEVFYPLGGSTNAYTVIPGANMLEDSFESGLLYWKSGGTHDCWGVTAHSTRTGEVSVSDSPNIYYYDNTDSWLESTFSLNLTGGPASMSFYYKGSLQSDRDFLYVEASTDGGQTWEQASDPIDGTEFDFVEYAVGLNDFTGNSYVRLRFHLTSDGSGRRDGIFIDDITIAWSQTDVEDDDLTVPAGISLGQNYPNPFNPSTSISLSLAQESRVSLTVYDLLGRSVVTLVSSVMDAGDHMIEWDGTDYRGDDVASGIYLYRLDTENISLVKKMTLLR